MKYYLKPTVLSREGVNNVEPSNRVKTLYINTYVDINSIKTIKEIAQSSPEGQIMELWVNDNGVEKLCVVSVAKGKSCRPVFINAKEDRNGEITIAVPNSGMGARSYWWAETQISYEHKSILFKYNNLL